MRLDKAVSVCRCQVVVVLDETAEAGIGGIGEFRNLALWLNSGLLSTEGKKEILLYFDRR